MPLRLMTFFVAMTLLTALSAAAADEVPRVTVDQLHAMLTDPAVLVVDVRAPHDWQSSDVMIAGAKRMEPNDTGWILAEPKDRPIVFYCA